MKILIVGLSYSVHVARWANQLIGQNWDIRIFPSIDCGIVHEDLKDVMVYQTFFGSAKLNRKVRNRGLNVINENLAKVGIYFMRKYLPNSQLSRLARLITKFKPDVIHSMEIQHAGYLTLEAKKIFGKKLPPWIVTNWGSDIYLFGRLAGHKEKIIEVLSNCDYYSCECERDADLARQFGFKGTILPIIPNVGGFDLLRLSELRKPGLPSSRRGIMVKGYQTWAGRALVAIRALERCADILSGYSIYLYLVSGEDVRIATELLGIKAGIEVIEVPGNTKNEEILRLHGCAKISIGLSISDAISTSFLEAIAMGSFPIQSNTSCANEWIIDGKTGLLVPPEDPEVVEKAIRRALADDKLIDEAMKLNLITVAQRLDLRKNKHQAIQFYLAATDSNRKRKKNAEELST